MLGAFERYAPFVQEYIYRNRWENLRAIQVAAAHAIFNTDENVLLTASTASGKTEAAILPHHHPVFGGYACVCGLHLHWPSEGADQ